MRHCSGVLAQLYLYEPEHVNIITNAAKLFRSHLRRRRSFSLLVLHFQLQQVAHATLALFVDEVLAVAEGAPFELRLLNGLPLWHSNILSIQSDEGVLGGV